MAAITGTVLAAGATAYAADKSSDAAKDGARAVTGAQREAQAASNANFQPYLNAGSNALTQIQQLNAGNMDSFNESPDYQFTLTQGLQGLDRSAAARGSLFSGGQTADVLNYASGLASQQFNNYRNNLLQLAGMGQSAAGAIAGVNTGAANAIGNANANAAYAQADAKNQLVAGLAGLAANYGNNYASSRTSAYGSPSLATQANGITQANNLALTNNLSKKWGT